MSWQDLADLTDPATGETRDGTSFSAYYPFEADRNSAILLAPDGLDVAPRADGLPDLMIETVRAADGEVHGVLNFRVAARYSFADALDAVRKQRPGATLRPLALRGGFLRLWPEADLPQLSAAAAAALARPVPLSWNELGRTAFRAVLPSEAIELIERALQAEHLMISAYGELEFDAYAPRVDGRVEFDPEALLAWLAQTAAAAGAGDGPRRNVSRSAVLKQLGGPLDSLPLKLTGAQIEPRLRAEVLTCWVVEKYGKLVPGADPNRSTDASFALPDRGALGSTPARWDLAQPLPTRAPLVLRLHPLEAARKIVASGRGIAPFVRTIDVPALNLGIFAVNVSANLPRHTAQIVEVDVELFAPSDPSQGRPGAISQTVRLRPPEFSASTLLRFSPEEVLRYAWRASLALDDGSVLAFDSDDGRRWTDAAAVVIDADAMPARFILVEPETALGTSAALKCVCSWSDGGAAREQTFDIGVGGSGDDGACFVLPPAAANTILRVEARAPTGGAPIVYGPIALTGSARIPLGLYSFREFGPQTVKVRALFGEHSPDFVWVDLRPQTAEKTAKTLTLDAAHDSETWSWTADSIFAAGYRYRIRHEENADNAGEVAEPGPPWSDVQSPFADLTLDLRFAPAFAPHFAPHPQPASTR